MNVKRILGLVFSGILLGPLPATAQGFAGMASDADGFSLPAPDPKFEFPRDHGAHPDFRIEWWYVTANLQAEDGTEYGAQWTLFRSALAPPETPLASDGWSSSQIWFAHAGVTSRDTHLSGETFARGGTGQAGVDVAPFSAWIDDWSMISRSDQGEDAFAKLEVSARTDAFSYALSLQTDAPLVRQGDNGFSVKSPSGQASYYYSQPHYQVEGQLDLPDGRVAVTGQAWLDREWSSQPLTATQTGWDWFSLHLDTGAKLMVYRLRDSAAPAFVPGTWVTPEGDVHPIPNGEVSLRPLKTQEVQGRDIPVTWEIRWPGQDLVVQTTPLNPESWMDAAVPYWEGPIHVSGTHSGRGYLEMTGYEQR